MFGEGHKVESENRGALGLNDLWRQRSIARRQDLPIIDLRRGRGYQPGDARAAPHPDSELDGLADSKLRRSQVRFLHHECADCTGEPRQLAVTRKRAYLDLDRV